MLTTTDLNTLSDELIAEIQSSIDEIGHTKLITLCKLHEQIAVAQFVKGMHMAEFYRSANFKKSA